MFSKIIQSQDYSSLAPIKWPPLGKGKAATYQGLVTRWSLIVVKKTETVLIGTLITGCLIEVTI